MPARLGAVLRVALIAGAIFGCSRAVNTTALRSVSMEATPLLQANQGAETIDERQWPPSIRKLHPIFIHTDRAGLYVAMHHLFVSESGYFIPRNAATFVATQGTDPSYVPLGGGAYWYKIEG
jgi:hypothetical protein